MKLPHPILVSSLFDASEDWFAGMMAEDEIQLWLISLSADERILEFCFDSLAPDEKARAGKFLSEPARQCFVITRAALRRILRGYHAMLPADFPISTGTHGKTFLESAEVGKPIHFNVSHSGDLALIGCRGGAEIGVDLEEQRPVKGMMGIAQKVFSERELNFLQALPEAERATAFYRLWTGKEASLKASGTGFHRSPKSLCLFSSAESDTELPELIQTDDQSIQSLAHPLGYSLAWAVQTAQVPKVRWGQL